MNELTPQEVQVLVQVLGAVQITGTREQAAQMLSMLGAIEAKLLSIHVQVVEPPQKEVAA